MGISDPRPHNPVSLQNLWIHLGSQVHFLQQTDITFKNQHQKINIFNSMPAPSSYVILSRGNNHIFFFLLIVKLQ